MGGVFILWEPAVICFNLPPNVFESLSNGGSRGKHHLATLVAFAQSQPDITSSRAQMGLFEPGAKNPASVRPLSRWE